MASNEVSANGWTAVPVDAGQIFKGRSYINQPEAIPIDEIKFPSDDTIVLQVQEFSKKHLPTPTYNHSMRVFYWGTVIAKQQFPEHNATFSPSTFALTCLLHDIGTAEAYLATTRMSFEFNGAFQALNLLGSLGGEKDQAEAVAEAIIRHQDIGVDGTITFLGQLIQLATLYDNVSNHPQVSGIDKIIHKATLEEVTKAFPRHKWCGCFANTIREEKRLKPWCHSTHIVDFEALVESNELMKQYE